MSVLVTGGTGLIGSHVARRLLELGVAPVVFDLVPNMTRIEDIADHVTVVRGDVRSLSDLLRAAKANDVTRVIHLAAMKYLAAQSDPVRCVEVNCVGTGRVFEAAALLGIERVVWASTIGVFDRRPHYEAVLGRHLLDEDDPPHPPEIYGATMHLSEILAEQFIGAQGLDLVALRPTLTFGPGEYADASGALSQAMRDLALTGRATVKYPWRPDLEVSPVYVVDAADLFVQVCLRQERLDRHVYNMGTGETYTVGEMMGTASRLVPGSVLEFESAAPRPDGSPPVPHFDFVVLDSSALRGELNWTARYDLERAASECIAWYRDELDSNVAIGPAT
jgi:UDP-glucose 4-epimerase